MTQTNNERKALLKTQDFITRIIEHTTDDWVKTELREVFNFIELSLEQSPISHNEQQEPIALLALKNTELNRRIEVLEDLLASAAVISLRRGADTHWDRFIAQLKIKGICFVTPKTFKILPSDEEYTSTPTQSLAEHDNATIDRCKNIVADDALAITFQSMGAYRSAIIKHIGELKATP